MFDHLVAAEQAHTQLEKIVVANLLANKLSVCLFSRPAVAERYKGSFEVFLATWGMFWSYPTQISVSLTAN